MVVCRSAKSPGIRSSVLSRIRRPAQRTDIQHRMQTCRPVRYAGCVLTISWLWGVLVAGCAHSPSVPGDAASNKIGPPSHARVLSGSVGVERFVLPNGLVAFIREDHSAPVVAIQLWVGAGSIHEEEMLGSGLAHAVEHMIFKGTPTRAVGVITREINDAGGEINAFTGSDRTVFVLDMPADRWTLGLEVLADAVFHASFPEKEWTREREVILREIAYTRDDPAREIEKQFFATAYTVHPYRFPVIGLERRFLKLTRADLHAYFRRHYVPDNMLLVVVGDVDAREAHAQVTAIFGTREGRARPSVFLPAEPSPCGPRFSRISGPYHLSRVMMGWHTVSLTHPDTPALDLFAETVGSGRAARLNREICENRRLAYSVNAFSYTPKYPGVFCITAEFDTIHEEALLAALCDQVATWRADRFTEAEIDRARQLIVVREMAALQTMRGQADRLAAGEFYAGSPGYTETYLRLLEAVTSEHLQRVAEKYLRPEAMITVILAPSADRPTPPTRTLPPRILPPEKHLLSHGIPLVVREDHRLPLVYISAVLGGGLLAEEKSRVGITRLMADLLTRGTSSRTAEAIAQTYESLGASLTSFSGFNSFGLNARCRSQDTERILDLLSDCLLNPSFPEGELARQKNIQIAAWEAEREDPMFVAQQNLREILFPDHPYRWHPLGTPETIRAITREDLCRHLRSLRVSGNLVLAVVGDISAKDARRLAERAFGDVPRGLRPVPTCSPAKPSLPARIERAEPRQQAIMLLGYPGVDVRDSRADALDILETALSGLSSSMSMAVRERLGLSYIVGAWQQRGLEPGLFVLYAGVAKASLQETEHLMRQETHRLRTTGLRPDEIERARRQRIGEDERQIQDPGELAMRCALAELYGLGYQHPFTTRKRLEALSAEEIRRAAISLLVPEKEAVSLVHPSGKEMPASQPREADP